MEASDYLRELLAAGMTQSVVAERTGIPQPTISRIARGRVKDVPSKRSRKLHALWELEIGHETAHARGVMRMQAGVDPVEAKAA